jgi:prolyl-tRNA synthetase
MPGILEHEQAELLRQATALRDRQTRPVRTSEAWALLGPEGEQRVLQDGISVRCLVRADGEPVVDPNDDGVEAIVARAY